jgi:hypothetical protein
MTFVWKNPTKKHEREFIWFARWMKEGYSLRQLMKQSGHSRRRLQQIISYWLQHPPAMKDLLTLMKHLVFDGTYIGNRRHSVFGCLNAKDGGVVAGEYGIKEGSRKMFDFLISLKKRGLNPISATIDGNPAVSEALRALWPNIIIQRCLVHVQRQGLMWCRINPKRRDAKLLRAIFLRVTCIYTKDERDIFLSDIRAWEQHYGCVLARRPERGWVFSDLKRARSMLLKALPNMFRYLDDPSVPKSSNMIEGFFSRMKELYRGHRGIREKQRSVYFCWHFFLNQRRSSNTK